MSPEGPAPGAPGISPTWTAGAKDAVTAGLGSARVWATVGRGVLNEVYWPSTGSPQVRELRCFVRTADRWTDLAAAGRYTVTYPRPDVPVPTVVHHGPGYEVTVDVAVDPLRDALLVRYALAGGDEIAFQLDPSLGGHAAGNRARVRDDAGVASGGGVHLAVIALDGVSRSSAGFVGTSDAATDLAHNGTLTWSWAWADDGDVALTLVPQRTTGALAIAFADGEPGAIALARSLLAEGPDAVHTRAVATWSAWADTLAWPDVSPALAEHAPVAAASVAVLKVHEDVTFPGAIVASLSLPWGTTHEDAGGYHLVWPRDAVQSALALLAAGQADDARRVLAYLVAMQAPDGHWPQNFFPDGTGYWSGLQLDETALPIVLAAALREAGAPSLPGTTAMVRRAVGYLAANGPMSQQDRWEENPGANAFTLATTIAALTAAAPWLEGAQAADAQDVADEWNERVESWTFVSGTPLAATHGVGGYYVRLAPPVDDGGLTGMVHVRNREGVTVAASALVSMDFLALVRYGLRDPHDERIVDTVRVVDDLLATDTPSGVVYRRYNEDGYGEHDDGRPYDGTGRGRPWPLLTGERGHYALQRGDDPAGYLATMHRCTGAGGLLPEQVWDGPPLPAAHLEPGRPTGGAMPLAWAHAEFLKLYLASTRGRPFELLGAVAARYGASMPAAMAWRWRTDTPIHQLPTGRDLIVEAPEPFTLHAGWDGWHGVHDIEASEALPGRWSVRLDTATLAEHDTMEFTRRFAAGWEGRDHALTLQHPHGDRQLHVHPA